MTGSADSETTKARHARVNSDQAVLAAVRDYQRELDSNNGHACHGYGSRHWADIHGVSHSTMLRKFHGGQLLSEFNSTKRLTTDEEEEQLVEYCLFAAGRGFGLDIAAIEAVANAMIGARDPGQTVGINWVDRFIDRHDELTGHWSRHLAKVRAQAANPEGIAHYYKHVVHENIYDRPDGQRVATECIYALDEAGVSKGFHTRTRIIGRSSEKMAYQQGVEDRELITVMTCICADGTAVRPMFIFPGESVQADWGKNNVLKATLAASTTGWTNNELGLQYLKIFDELTREKANGRLRVLFVDGHGSHLTIEFIRYAMRANIVVLAYPPHTTHILQGLDVVVFASLKKHYADEVKAFEASHGGLGIRKRDFAQVFGKAYLRAFVEPTIKAAFSKTGIVPYNPAVIDARKLAPSTATSTVGQFPHPQPSPVRRVMAAYSTHMRAGPSQESDALPIDPALLASIPQTPPRPRVLDIALQTPGARMRTLEASLASSCSASALVSHTRITAAQATALTFPPVTDRAPASLQPDWSVLHNADSGADELRAQLVAAQRLVAVQDGIIEAANAQLVIQGMVLRQSNLALYGKEERENEMSSRSLFPKGLGMVVTHEDLVNRLAEKEAEREAEQVEKEERERVREQKRQDKLAAEAAWAARKEAHALEKEAHRIRIEQLKAQGIPKKDWPRGPGRLTKAGGSKSQGAEQNDESEDDDDAAAPE